MGKFLAILAIIMITATCLPTPKPEPRPPLSKTCNPPRDSHGRIKRSASARKAFQKAHPCPSTHQTTGKCPGYVVDHIIPLYRCGPDTPANMQWQTTREAKEKDRTE